MWICRLLMRVVTRVSEDLYNLHRISFMLSVGGVREIYRRRLLSCKHRVRSGSEALAAALGSRRGSAGRRGRRSVYLSFGVSLSRAARRPPPRHTRRP
ncbi:hypothetical protein EVAR_27873_1 [Eumeta japonica]|uniref:Uncharacterized protein n=1 Tax=Eumeta variegata TaxID=151549 RepID=A0A4C1VLP6_EUMVA|nr:hypothetical protein EVAR_27873_1 [Eumeta japonica]